VAQEELNGFLSIAEELKVKGLTQGNDTGGSNKRSRSPAPSKPSSSLPVKRPRPPDPVQPVQVDDDIQEVVPVKTEPALASATSYTGQQQQVATYDEENYAEYGEYEDQQGYTDAGIVDFNQSMDGNKDLHLSTSIEDQIASMMYQTENKKWRCAICNQESIGKTDITRHVESKHIENHPGYACDL